ncbi:hypothetical protein [uncultured Devosia sp.]|mgnify:CR=1 FL=1|uniref:hypothetical protein n=1 Tax=uncultured Devosia sp. TaxID=211434 RepID=UPI002637C401|nr:hypothetical protein [uncultured Devosia sp.]
MDFNPVKHVLDTQTQTARTKRTRRSTHSILVVTRYASLEPASISAAVKDGLEELLDGRAPRKRAKPLQIFVYFRNRHRSTVTLEIGLPLNAPVPSAALNGLLKRRQNVPSLLLDTADAPDGLARAMDEAMRILKVPSRGDLPELWQVFDLPFTGYEPAPPLAVGFPRNRRGQS